MHEVAAYDDKKDEAEGRVVPPFGPFGFVDSSHKLNIAQNNVQTNSRYQHPMNARRWEGL